MLRLLIGMVMVLRFAGQPSHPFDGQWIADMTASRFNGAVAIKSATLEFRVSEDAVIITNHTTDPSGRDFGGSSTFRTDGQPHTHDELMPGLMVAAKWSGDRLLDTVLTRRTGEADHVTYEVSADGKTLITKTVGSLGTQEIVFKRANTRP